MEKTLSPLYKWTGGKRREIKLFDKYYPSFVKEKKDFLYVEPFFGAGAVYWSMSAERNLINDIDKELINFLVNLKDNPAFIKNTIANISDYITEVTLRERNKEISISEAKTERGLIYYEWRNKDRNNGLSKLSPQDRAARFFIVNQLAFNGMRRFNSKGEFNIPYGNYKSFNLHIEQGHLDLLNKTQMECGDYKNILSKADNKDTFIFIDPPYTREFTEYSHEAVFGEKEQLELFDVFKNLKEASAMIIINKDDFTVNLYKEFIKDEYDLKYATNIKNRYSNAVQHLIITNYDK